MMKGKQYEKRGDSHMQTVQEKIGTLREEIERHDKLYEENRPEIADGEYDALYRELVQLETEHPEFHDESSPTNRIVTSLVSELKKVRHNSMMGSQEKANSWEEVEKFLKRSDSDILVQLKLDGLTVVGSYQDGKFTQAVTRGDGEIGEDVTHTVRTLKNLPLSISFKEDLEVRMEGLIPFVEFERINETESYSNPRNLVSGTIRQLDASVAEGRGVLGIVFEYQQAGDAVFEQDSDRLEFLKNQGFEVVQTQRFANTADGRQELKRFIEDMESTTRATLPYLIDGLIIKFDDLSERERLGSTNKYPKWSIAYKFEAQEATTTLRGVTLQVGKTGQITPVAELDTVTIDNVNISRATLHNYGYLEDKDIRIGDTVTVVRANDVIPQVTNAIVSLRKGKEEVVTAPDSCPECGSPTEFIGANLYCTGIDCRPQLKGKIEYFASRKALNIDGLGKSTIELFFDHGFIRNFLDLYRLKDLEEEILLMRGYGHSKFKKLLEGLETAKSAPLSKVLTALSIRLIGSSVAKVVAKEYRDMQELLDDSANRERFESRMIAIDGFGKEMSKSIADFFFNEQNRAIIQEMLEIGYVMKGDKKEEGQTETTDPSGASLTGKSFVITGSLSKGRDDFKDLVESLGGKVSGSVSSKTDYLLMGDDAEGTSKHKKALSVGTTILNEESFWKLIQ